MVIETTRFGPVEVDETRLINFADGLVGFPQHRRFALMATGQASSFYWLQSVDDPNLAFVVADPRLLVPQYDADARPEERVRLGATDTQPLQWFVIVNKIDSLLTGNLQGPLVVNPENRAAMQLVLSDKRYNTRYPLMRLPARQAVTQSA